MFRQMHAIMEGYRALKVLEQFKSDLPTYMPKRSVLNTVNQLQLFSLNNFPEKFNKLANSN